jgi:hypothetical protein
MVNVVLDNIVDVSEVYAASIFRVLLLALYPIREIEYAFETSVILLTSY